MQQRDLALQQKHQQKICRAEKFINECDHLSIGP